MTVAKTVFTLSFRNGPTVKMSVVPSSERRFFEVLADRTQTKQDRLETAKNRIYCVIGEIDRLVAGQLAAICSHPKFDELSSAWRSLHFLVMKTEVDTDFRIRMLNATKSELSVDPFVAEVAPSVLGLTSWRDQA